jgi:hypothetical protein
MLDHQEKQERQAHRAKTVKKDPKDLRVTEEEEDLKDIAEKSDWQVKIRDDLNVNKKTFIIYMKYNKLNLNFIFLQNHCNQEGWDLGTWD